MKLFVDKILSELRENSRIKKIEVHSFDSGAFMIDVWIDQDFYCIQFFDNNFGYSKADTSEINFSTIPDNNYNNYESFIASFLRALNSDH